ncbi:DinB family protein [Arachnia propionica]|uniref:DinB family protein n=1 Tax=Arachnia propionica TaxID=1750 RepID=A0A3P1T8I7_9ACTN|nr:DinB family protein [Arachnia propionica]RRD05146.1 DinB family protein [Arachnia propionica]
MADDRPEPPTNASEETTLLGFLDFLRATIAMKTSGLSDEELHTRSTCSAMTLGGLLKHLAFVESYWFIAVLSRQETSRPWGTLDWRDDPDWDWTSAADQSGEQLRTLWQDSVVRSRVAWAGFRATNDLGTTVPRGDDRVSARWVLTHMIEEYARHCGHADLLREAIDGVTGE